jgi:putative ABC transport system permease protein
MALAATYTATDSVLWERTRELATLRTLGFGMGFIARIVSLENLCVAALGAALGVLPGTMLSDYLLRASSTEGFTLRPAVSVTTITLAVAGPLVLTLLSQLPGLRRIARLDLASEIRVREQ